jgi:hypothetical protein
MRTLIRSAVIVAALLATGSAAMAENMVPNQSDQYGGYAPNSSDGVRAFWDHQARRGS